MPAYFVCVHILNSMSEFTNYVQFNQVTVAGRIAKAEVVTSKKDNDQFLAVTVLTTLTTNGQTTAFTFTDSNGLLGLFNAGYLPVGRQVTITGHISGVKETYVDRDGNVNLLSTPQIKLSGASIPDGGLGAMPKDKTTVIAKTTVVRPSAEAPVDEAPQLATATAYGAGVDPDQVPDF